MEMVYSVQRAVCSVQCIRWEGAHFGRRVRILEFAEGATDVGVGVSCSELVCSLTTLEECDSRTARPHMVRIGMFLW